ncbi:MAG: glycosyltransferase family 2 protein [Nitrospirota bacterium]|nr:MAG: glycosyltransferase family 2 protein [Nitrospirota bacterium]
MRDTMNTGPLVSVIMPAYNTAGSIRFALASLFSQTYSNWECIISDDGSDDGTSEIIYSASAVDKRIRITRSDSNRGRGWARQAALDIAQGQYLAMLDADDWWYPDKLELQLDVMVNDGSIALVSSGMAIVDVHQSLIGIRKVSTDLRGVVKYGPAGLGFTSVPHAPSLINMEIARRAGYDISLRRAEDMDFMLRILMNNRYAVIPGVHYAYCEMSGIDIRDILLSHANVRRFVVKYLRAHPLISISMIIKTYLRSAYYWTGDRLGLMQNIIRSRSKAPSDKEIDQYQNAYETVSGVYSEVYVDL